MTEKSARNSLVEAQNVVFVIKVEHTTSKSGHRNQKIIQQTDLFTFQDEVGDNFCRKDKETNTQMKFSCNPCRKVLESVDALRSHLQGGKHLANLENPPDYSNHVLENGKWKAKKGSKRSLPDDLSRREQTKRNKIQRNIPILPQHTEEKFNETETYFEDGYRRVRPYYFTFVAHAKGRWVGQELQSVFSREFRAMGEKEFVRCIERGLVMVNNKPTSPHYKVEGNDFISHKVHRHELPVTDKKIEVIHEDEDVVVIDKPSSIPVHPCGRYRHNTITFILAKEQGYKTLHTVHRLDRLTSGVLIFTKSAQKSRELFELISGRHVTKEYLCRVDGEFPAGEVVCDEPILVISYKIGVCIVSNEGKECKTVFQRVAYKDGVSIVRCRPRTGRMHQIRVHLQYLGFPISNDPLYNSNIFGPERGKGGVIGKTKEELIQDLIKEHTVETWIQTEQYQNSQISDDPDDGGQAGMKDLADETEIENPEDTVEETANQKEPLDATTHADTELTSNSCATCTGGANENGATKEPKPVKEYWDEDCADCTIVYKDPPRPTMLIYLHALRYAGEGWEYKTQTPAWANLG